MRIITTWMYFDPSQIQSDGKYRRRRGRGEDIEPGIGIAWCAGDTTSLMPISNLKIFREFPVKDSDFNEQVLRSYIDAFLVDEDDYDFIRPDRSIKNPAIVDYVLSQKFVIERSPPDLLSLKGAITKTNLPVWIGTYMGWSAVPDHSVLLFISVPGGIIIVSSAIGLANALAARINKSVKRLFDNR